VTATTVRGQPAARRQCHAHPAADRVEQPGDANATLAAVSFTMRGLLRGAKRALPLVLSDAAYGLVFGALARQAGLSVVETALMSGLVFAGSAQVIALGMWATPLPVVSLILTTLIVNLRHVMMGAVVHPRLERLSPPKVYGTLFFLTDESWALSVGDFEEGERDGAFLLWRYPVNTSIWRRFTAATVWRRYEWPDMAGTRADHLCDPSPGRETIPSKRYIGTR
jgi:predicted branched-subunit amino acid permease